jgi:quinol monooxygenase YgiN
LLIPESAMRSSVLSDAARALNGKPECELYIVNVVDDEPDAVWVTELWASQEAHAQSLHDEEVNTVVQRGIPLIAEVP